MQIEGTGDRNNEPCQFVITRPGCHFDWLFNRVKGEIKGVDRVFFVKSVKNQSFQGKVVRYLFLKDVDMKAV
jgi:hypothetical protein